MNPYAVASLFSAVATTVLGMLVFLRGARNTLNRVFGLLCLTLSYWSFVEFELRDAESLERAIFWTRVDSLAPFAIALLAHFILVFSEANARRVRVIMAFAGYLPAAAFSVLAAVGPVHPAQVAWGWSDTPSQRGMPLAAEYALYAWTLLLTLGTLLHGASYYRRATSSRRRAMAAMVLLGVSVPVVAGVVSEIALPLWGVFVPELTSSASAVMCLFIAYAIWKHQLFALDPGSAADSIVATMSDALFLVDTNHMIRATNNAACRLLGYEEAELIGHPADRVFSGSENQVDGDTSLMRMMKTGVINDVETVVSRKDGRRIPVSLSWSVTRTRQREPIGITFIARDITERQRLHEALQRANEELEHRVQEQTQELTVANKMLRQEISERMQAEDRLASEKEHLAVTLSSIAEGVIATDADGRVSLLNRVAEQLTGWSLADALGRRLRDIYHVRDERTRERCPDPAEGLLGAGDAAAVSPSAILVGRDSSERTITQSCAPIRYQSGKVLGAVLVFRDITDHRKLEDRLFKARKLESLSLLAGGIAHDFNNILTGIMTTLFVARTQVPAQSEAHKLLAEAEQSAFRASTLTKQLMGFAKGSSPVRQRVPLRTLAQEAVGFCLSGSPIDYELSLADDLAEVEADRGQVDQALTSVIQNAVEAMDGHGTIRIRAENRGVGPQQSLPLREGRYVVVSVRDEGPGIPENHLHRVFDPYFTTKMDHSGLGLTTAYSVMANHDGCIDIESRLGAGTTVSLYLPVAGSMEEAVGPSDDGAAGASSGRVLLMEESDFTRNSIVKLVEHLGYECEGADSSQEAVAVYEQARREHKPFAAVILNLTMRNGPGGSQTLEELRKLDATVKAIVTSGLASDPVMVGFREHGFAAALVKPYGASQLDATLRALCGDAAASK